MSDDDLDFHPFGGPVPCPVCGDEACQACHDPLTNRPRLARTGPLGTLRDDASIAEADNRRARRPRRAR